VTYHNSSYLTCVTYSGATTLDEPVAVQVSTLTSGMVASSSPVEGNLLYTFHTAPSVAHLSVLEGPVAGGTRLRIAGTHLGLSLADVRSVTVDGAPCVDVAFLSSIELACTTTDYAALHDAPYMLQAFEFAGPVVVATHSGGVSEESALLFTYIRAPVVEVWPGGGNDTLCESNQTHPCQSIQGALDAYPRADVTVVVRAGAYVVADGLKCPSEGARFVAKGGAVRVDCAASRCFQVQGYPPAAVTGFHFRNGLGVTCVDSNSTNSSDSNSFTATSSGGGRVCGDGDAAATEALEALAGEAKLADVADVAFGGGVVVLSQCTHPVVFQDCLFDANAAVFGAAVWVSQCAEVAFINCSITGSNRGSGAQAVSGAVHVTEDSAVAFNDCNFSANEATYGGAVSATASATVTVVRCAYSENEAHQVGGAVYVADAALAVEDSRFLANAAGLAGGAVCAVDGSSVVVRGSWVGDNWARQVGGAVYMSQSSADVSSCQFRGNEVLAVAAEARSPLLGGGAIKTEVSSLQLADVVFSDNLVWSEAQKEVVKGARGRTLEEKEEEDEDEDEDDGGEVVEEEEEEAEVEVGYGGKGGALQLVFSEMGGVNVTLSGNGAGSGGAVSVETQSKVEFERSLFSGNVAQQLPGAGASMGGAMHVFAAAGVQVRASRVEGNSAEEGGGLYLERSIASVVEDSDFTGNHAVYGGAAISSHTGGLALTGGSATGNAVSQGGGGAFLLSEDDLLGVQLESVKVSGNTASFGADFASPPTALSLVAEADVPEVGGLLVVGKVVIFFVCFFFVCLFLFLYLPLFVIPYTYVCMYMFVWGVLAHMYVYVCWPGVC
jgi:hypothetical protein